MHAARQVLSVLAVSRSGARALRPRVSSPVPRVRFRTVAMAAPGDEQTAALEAHLRLSLIHI